MDMVTVAVFAMMVVVVANGGDTNNVFDPCSDSKVKKSDGFTFGIAFSSKDDFFFDSVQLSPCDSRLALSSKNAQLALFRPKVDEISLLTINSTAPFDPFKKSGGFMVAFAGRKYAARSIPIMVSDPRNTITSFTLVLEFQQGTLINLHWKSTGCDSCKGRYPYVCLDKQDCAIPTSQCKGQGGSVNCDLSVQLAFSGTDMSLEALNSWYEVSNLRKHSLYGLFSDVRDSITNPFS